MCVYNNIIISVIFLSYILNSITITYNLSNYLGHRFNSRKGQSHCKG